jgi:hypothetical protein
MKVWEMIRGVFRKEWWKGRRGMGSFYFIIITGCGVREGVTRDHQVTVLLTCSWSDCSSNPFLSLLSWWTSASVFPSATTPEYFLHVTQDCHQNQPGASPRQKDHWCLTPSSKRLSHWQLWQAAPGPSETVLHTGTMGSGVEVTRPLHVLYLPLLLENEAACMKKMWLFLACSPIFII